MTETADINKTLADDGWAITPVLVNPGDHKTASAWQITITRNNAGFSVPCSMGCAHRMWKPHARGKAANMDTSRMGRMKAGSDVPMMYGKMTVDDAWILDNCTEPRKPELSYVLYSVVSDAQSVCCGQTFEEWCGELGYDTDSRKAEKSFNACRDEWSGLIRLGADIEKLSELFQDY